MGNEPIGALAHLQIGRAYAMQGDTAKAKAAYQDLCYWVFSPSETRFAVIPLVFALGSLTLLVKGVFLLRKSSEGLGLSEQELAKLSDPALRKSLPPLTQAAQVIQDFGTGPLLLWPLLMLGKDFDNSWSDPPRFRVFLAGAIIFSLGWVIRRLTSSPTA